MHNEKEIYWKIQCKKREKIIQELLLNQVDIKKKGERIINDTKVLMAYYTKEIANLRVTLLEKENDIQDLLAENEYLKHQHDSVVDIVEKNI